MLKIGVIVGREWSWPPAFIEEVNGRNAGVIAEYAKLGGTPMNAPCEYAVLVDRISHEVPYYRSFLKNALLQGTHVVNNPFMWTADDKFFGASLITKLGIHSPRTIALPNKEYIPGIVHTESLRNLEYPIDWQGLVNGVGGFPVILKDAHGGGWKQVHVCRSMDDLWNAYNQSGLLTMVLQEFIKWDPGMYVRCMCIDRQHIKVRKYDPDTRKYLSPEMPPKLLDQIVDESRLIVRALGYDMNTIEWAIRDGVPYAIDFMNPAPDMDVNSTGQDYHRWCVEKMADMCLRLATNPEPQVKELRWSTLFNA
jgi:hypothetical protein